MDVTVIILTKNEEVNIPECIKSLDGFAKRVVVVDSFSTDRTEKIAREMGAEFYQNKFQSPEIFNHKFVLSKINELHNGVGLTFFEIVLEIIANHDNIMLIND